MGSGVSRVLDLQSLRARFNALDQGHVFRFWDLLGEVEQEALLSQLGSRDVCAPHALSDPGRTDAAGRREFLTLAGLARAR